MTFWQHITEILKWLGEAQCDDPYRVTRINRACPLRNIAAQVKPTPQEQQT